MAAQKDNNWLHALLSDNTVRMHDNQTAVQQNTNHLHALMSDNAARLHNNQTVIQLNTNQLHAIMSENAVRAYELGLTTLLDIVTIGHRQYEGQRTITVCCMVIIAHLVYLLGTAVGEINSLRSVLQSHLDMEVPVRQSPPAFEIRDVPSWSALAWLSDIQTVKKIGRHVRPWHCSPCCLALLYHGH